ncbi:hypothetical protein IHE45_05G011700 [Dioscorea alata]|uniref:Uncharacterized protein n=1 Tax=Dioscorea alata TaxID=55571 RepID=A0ACB7VZY6_DIOAL|nr:hypothetical protein IHE45_05G011700 [Dioscorea alata]
MSGAFLPNHEDGELWLPSDLYPDVEVHRSPELAYVEDLVKQLTAFGLLAPASGPAPTMSYSRNPEGFRPVARFEPERFEMETRFGYGRFRAPVPASGGLGLGFGPRRVYPNGFFPVQRVEPVGKCVGTGVFFPRVNPGYKADVVRGGRQEKPALKNAGKKGMSCHSPTEIALPQDWTY